ncbi:sulfite exporter TauE/SafE family protein [Rhodosalinus sp.]|uniref:sulfite exporter TauE/SafE family protein n=1 Tax=Rhodosalinus sp. TaxID=2047741 RepID=UPI00397DFF36
MEEGLLLIALAFAAGGVLKGAIGAGVPVIVVPIMALYHGVPFAVAVFALPSLLSNGWQGWHYRAHLLPARFLILLTLGAGLGAAIGSVLLAALSGPVLMGTVAGMTLAYVAFRFARPHWVLERHVADRLVMPAGLVAGVMQGAAGISAPVSITFISAMRLPREAFIATISVLFLAMSVVQIPALWSLGILTPDRLMLSLAACVPLFGGMPVGNVLARYMARETFDRIVMALLVVIAVRLAWAAVA